MLEVTTPEAGELLEIIQAGVSHRRFAAPVAFSGVGGYRSVRDAGVFGGSTPIV